MEKLKRYKKDVSIYKEDISEVNYYLRELKKILPIDKYGATIVISSTSGKTKHLSLNRSFIKAFNSFIKSIDLN